MSRGIRTLMPRSTLKSDLMTNGPFCFRFDDYYLYVEHVPLSFVVHIKMRSKYSSGMIEVIVEHKGRCLFGVPLEVSVNGLQAERVLYSN
jgi:hypothetical protein